MSLLSCFRIRSLLSRGTKQLTQGQRLQLELHRGACSACRDDAAFDEALRTLEQQVPSRISSASYERSLAKAFSAPAHPRPLAGSPRLALAIGAAALAVAAVALVVFRGASREQLSIEIPEAPASATENSEPGGETILAAKQTQRLAHASVRATLEARYTWHESNRQLELESGALRVAVTPNTGDSFVVSTPSFDVFVLGTEFDVALDEVSVHRGVVEVRTERGALIETLRAGQTWRLSDWVARNKQSDTPASTETTATWLKRAGKHLRARRFSKTRRAIRRALETNPKRNQRAEAHMLEAELALATGNSATAIKRYRRVADRFKRSAHGEAALFAAARLEARRGRKGAARALLLRYRRRYPDGRFAGEVSRKLEAFEK